jgi:hypothetical protein
MRFLDIIFYFNSFLEKSAWIKIAFTNFVYPEPRYGHTINMYKNNLVIHAGETKFNKK